MSNKTKWPAALAEQIATNLKAVLLPLCQPGLCEVAGSLRRRKAEVGDVEILYVPRVGRTQRPGEMFESEGLLADVQINRWLYAGKIHKRLKTDGTLTGWGMLNKFAVHTATGVPVDFFATTWDNWFVSLVIRTGPKESNIRLIEAAKKRGLQLHAYGAFTRIAAGTTVCPGSEREVFELCGAPYAEPWERA